MRLKSYSYLWFAIFLMVYIFFPALSSAELFPLPPIEGEEKLLYFINSKEKNQYINKKWGIDPMNTNMKITNRIEETPAGKKLVQISEGRDEKVGGAMIVTNEFDILPEGIRQTIFDKKILDMRSNEVIFHYNVDFAKMGNLFPPDTYTSEVFSLVIRGIDYETRDRISFNWWGSERSVVPLYTKVKRPKEIEVKAGKFLCHRVEVWADLSDFARIGNFLLKVLKPFLPVYVNYITVSKPHQFIAFEGPIGPPGSPEVLIELMEDISTQSKGKEADKAADDEASSLKDTKEVTGPPAIEEKSPTIQDSQKKE